MGHWEGELEMLGWELEVEKRLWGGGKEQNGAALGKAGGEPTRESRRSSG